MADPYAVLAQAEADDFDAAAANLEPAIEYFLEHDRVAALRLLAALAGYWQDAGRVDEGRALTENAIKGMHRRATHDPAVAVALPRALLAASELAFRQGDQEMAIKRAHDTIRAAVLVEDYPTAALAHTDLARVAYRAGDAAAIEKHARKALEMAGNDTLARRGALHMLAWAAHTAGDLDEAERRFEESLAYRRQHGSRLSVAVEIANLGDLAAERGDLGRAAAMLGEALAVGQEIDSRYMIVNTLPSVAALAVRAGMFAEGARLFGATDSIANAAGLVPDPNSDADDARRQARDRLGDADFALELAEGGSLAADDAVALALSVARRIEKSGLRGP